MRRRVYGHSQSDALSSAILFRTVRNSFPWLWTWCSLVFVFFLRGHVTPSLSSHELPSVLSAPLIFTWLCVHCCALDRVGFGFGVFFFLFVCFSHIYFFLYIFDRTSRAYNEISQLMILFINHPISDDFTVSCLVTHKLMGVGDRQICCY